MITCYIVAFSIFLTLNINRLYTGSVRSKMCVFYFQEDPLLEKHRFELIRDCSRKLDKARMIRFDERTSYVYPTNLGRTASNFYIDFATIEVGF